MAAIQATRNIITGKVVADASSIGIPDLLVVAIDLDLNRFVTRSDEPTGGHTTDKTTPATTSTTNAMTTSSATPSDLLLQAALAAMDREPTDAYAPQRLGSVLTERDGAFRIDYADDLFHDNAVPNRADKRRMRLPEPDVRPDIVLLVLAPDRPDENGAGRSVKERLLFHSRPIRFEAGRIEAEIIRIGEERLATFDIQVAGDGVGDTQTSPLRYAAARTAQYTRDAELLNVRTNLFLQFEVPQLKKQKQALTKFLPNLLPAAGGAKPHFIGFTPTYNDLVSKAWNQISILPWLMIDAPRTGRVYLNHKDLEVLGTNATAIAATPAGDTITFGTLLHHIGYGNGPYRNRDLSTQIELKRTIYRLNHAPAPVVTPVLPGPVSQATTDSVRDSVLQRLQEQVEGLAREPEQADPAQDLSRIKRIIDSLEQTSGLTNVAAMHDIETLQVAFEPTWTAAFDEDLKQTVQQLYQGINREELQAASGVVFPAFEDIANVCQLRELLSDLAIAANSPYCPNTQHVGALAMSLATRLAERYSFTYFAPGSINYGMMLTYRQSWTPMTYQVGRLAETVPLAPGETRTLKMTRTVRRTRKQSSRHKSSLHQTRESSSVSRTEVDAMEKTAFAMSHQATTQAQFNIGIGSLGATGQFSLNSSAESQSVHKSFAEMARKSSQEVRREVELQVDTESTDETVSESTRTLKNPNDELTVTYLLYELERRYKVSSNIQAVHPVILVALDMPAPHEITDAWILEHEWVIRDVLLDPDLEEALDLLEDNRSQDDANIAILKVNFEAATHISHKADLEFERLTQLARARRQTIVDLMEGEGVVKANESGAGERVMAAVLSGGLSEFFGGGQSQQDEMMAATRQAIDKSLEYLGEELRGAAEARDRAISALNQATERYSQAVTTRAMTNQKLLQLRLHVRGHIFHYLHEIWRRRDPDDLFFSLFDLEVPFLAPQKGQCKLRLPTQEELDQQVPGVVIDGDLYMVDIHPATVAPSLANMPKKQLIEIADLDRPLGFKGNYVVFPLRENSLLTDYMIVSYLDGYYGVRDPALNASYSAKDLVAYAQTAWNDPVVNFTVQDKAKLAELILAAGRRNPGYDSDIVLPTGQIYMEALKGDQALLERFKLAHRGIDVLKVEEEVRGARLENLRRAQRVGMEDPMLDDPDIERTTLVRGLDAAIVAGPE